MLNNPRPMEQSPPGQTAPPYPQVPMAAPSSSFPSSSAQLTFQQAQQFHFQQQQQQNQQLQAFWAERILEIEQTTDFRNHSLPLARIKKIMKADEDVRMISAEAPVVFAKACEIFILELALRSWINTEENKRRTLQKNDIAAAITRTDIFDFLVDIVPRDEMKEEGLVIPRAGLPMVGGPTDNLPYYYGEPSDMYGAHRPQPGGNVPWQMPQVQLTQQQEAQQQQMMPNNGV